MNRVNRLLNATIGTLLKVTRPKHKYVATVSGINKTASIRIPWLHTG